MATWVCADIHGYYDIYEQINNFIASGDEVYFLGDAIDRGPDSYKTMKAIRENPYWHYYRGNHEEMLINALEEHLEEMETDEFPDGTTNWSYWKCLENGAMYKNKPSAWRIIVEQGEAAVRDWIDYLKNQTILYSIDACKSGCIIHLSHAGTSTPGIIKLTDDIEKDLIWDRSHIYENVDKRYSKNISIHGHTPCNYLQNMIKGQSFGQCKNNEPIFYQKNKLCIDGGVYHTGKVHLINLDTLTFNNIEYHTFETKEDLYGKGE